MTKLEAIESFDFTKEFSLKADVGAKIKAGVAAAAALNSISAKLEGDLKDACGTLAKDLGDTATYNSAADACKAAQKAFGDFKAKIGAKAKLVVDVGEPSCAVDVKAYGDCAAHCDANIKPGEVDVKCEPGKLEGTCSGQCSGECEADAGAACSGDCSGSCDLEMKGSCGGTCTGKCDSKPTAKEGASCGGVCEGKCAGNIKGTCKGKCTGSCKLAAKATCSGKCSGSCEGKVEAPHCNGKVEPPQMSAECKAKCDAGLQAKVECTPPHLVVRITGDVDAKTQASVGPIVASLGKDLPKLFAIVKGSAKNAGELVGSMKAVIEGVQAAVQTAGDPMAVGKLTACVGAPFKGALDAVGSVQGNVSVSVSVSASASAG
jgi:hypothetical protein